MPISDEALAIVVATFLGPIFAVVITLWRQSRNDKYTRRLYVFRALMATRGVGLSPEHVGALNLIEVDYFRCKGVQAAWLKYKDHLCNKGMPEATAWHESREKLLASLLHEMANILNFRIDAIDIFRSGYAPQGWAQRDAMYEQALSYVQQLAEGKKVVPLYVAGGVELQARLPAEDNSAATSPVVWEQNDPSSLRPKHD